MLANKIQNSSSCYLCKCIW